MDSHGINVHCKQGTNYNYAACRIFNSLNSREAKPPKSVGP